MRIPIIVNAIAFVAAVAACVVSYQLLAKHLTGSKGPVWFDAGCSDDPKAATNCGAVLTSPYGSWPPVREGDKPDKLRIPVAFLGLLYYSVLAAWLVGIGPPSRSRRFIHLAPLLFVGAGLAASAYFMYVMFTVLDQWCTWCLVTHILNLIIAVMIVLMWPRYKRPPVQPGAAAAASLVAKVRAASSRHEDDSTEQPPRPPQPPPKLEPIDLPSPTMRGLLITLVAICAVVLGQREMLAKSKFSFMASSNEESFKKCVQIVNKMKADPANLLAMWQKETPCEIVVAPDAPRRLHTKAEAPTLEVVAFSDLECPSCKRFAQFVETKVQPLFDGRLAVVFKHHPLDKTCNERIGSTVHPHACAAARMAEAARALGGNEAFWKTHDFLFEHQADLEKGRVPPERLAEALKLDPAAFMSAMESAEVTDRIQSDIEQAKTCNVASTPALYVGGRLVDTIPRGEIGFWDKLADMYWEQSGEPRPEKTRLPVPPATPGSPSRKDGQ